MGWNDLALASFKNSVARKHELGAHVHNNKKGRSSQPGHSHVTVAKPAADDNTAAARGVAGLGGSGASSGGGSIPAVVMPSSTGLGAAEQPAASAAAADWSNQPCPLTLPKSGPVMLLEEDLAGTLARSGGSRVLPSSGVLSSTRTTGTCLYKWKMGVYTNPSQNA